MGFNRRWRPFLAQPAFFLNLDRRPDRNLRTARALAEAGFSDVRRFAAIDGQTTDLNSALADHGIVNLRLHGAGKLPTQPELGCLLSHLAVLRLARDLDLPMVHIFEDDIAFHPDFARLGPRFLCKVPTGAEMIFMGSQIAPDDGTGSPRALARHPFATALRLDRWPHRLWGDLGAFPVYCLHAYSLTRRGIAALYGYLTQQEQGVYPVDCMVLDGQRRRIQPDAPPEGPPLPFLHSVWDARRFPCATGHRVSARALRNAGLVFQDADLGSDLGNP